MDSLNKANTKIIDLSDEIELQIPCFATSPEKRKGRVQDNDLECQICGSPENLKGHVNLTSGRSCEIIFFLCAKCCSRVHYGKWKEI